MEKTEHALRIVIADDEPIAKMDLRELLEDSGYEVVGEASDGFDAVEECRKNKPDLVLLDIKMPFLDGLSASKIIFQEKLADTIILLTAYTDPEFIESAKDCGVSGYLVKPYYEKSLIPSIELAVSRSREMKKIRAEVERAQERLESRVIIEKAKGLIMLRDQKNEEEAYSYIRQISQQKHLSMRRVSEMILVRSI